MMERLTIKGNFCDIARCQETHCQNGIFDAKLVYERLREYEATGLTPEQVKAQKWISVKERLPEKQTRVLVRTIGDYEGSTVGWIMWGKWVTDLGEQSKTVTHWMPLPEPPKEAHDE